VSGGASFFHLKKRRATVLFLKQAFIVFLFLKQLERTPFWHSTVNIMTVLFGSAFPSSLA